MKRTAHCIENNPPKAAAAAAKERIQRSHAERKNIGASRMARFRAEKAEALGDPLKCPEYYVGPAPFRIGYDGTIRPFSPQETPIYEGTTSVAPLTNEAIAAILKQTQPDCPRAQAWIRAHEASKMARGRVEARIADRDNLRRQAARKLRDRARQVPISSTAAKQDMEDVQTQSPEEEDADEQDDSKEDEMADMQERLERVSLAHERLVQAVEDTRAMVSRMRMLYGIS